MADRKIDYFGTFLESLKTGEKFTTPRTSEEAVISGAPVAPLSRPSEGAVVGGAAPAPHQTPDPLNEIVKILQDGPLPAAKLIPLVDNSISQFLSVIARLTSMGWIRQSGGDLYELTPQGREIAAVLD